MQNLFLLLLLLLIKLRENKPWYEIYVMFSQPEPAIIYIGRKKTIISSKKLGFVPLSPQMKSVSIKRSNIPTKRQKRRQCFQLEHENENLVTKNYVSDN